MCGLGAGSRKSWSEREQAGRLAVYVILQVAATGEQIETATERVA